VTYDIILLRVFIVRNKTYTWLCLADACQPASDVKLSIDVQPTATLYHVRLVITGTVEMAVEPGRKSAT